MKLSTIAKHLCGKLIGADADYKNISIDTRSLQPGDLFFAIKGDARDGHDFILEAEKAGAAAVVVNHDVDTILPKIIVTDSRKALFDLTKYYRESNNIPFIAITGSCGKTTTR